MNIIKDTAWKCREPRELLTLREHEVLELIALGLTNGAIGERLVVAAATVKGHVEQVLWKTRSANRLGAAMFYARRHPATGATPTCALLGGAVAVAPPVQGLVEGGVEGVPGNGSIVGWRPRHRARPAHATGPHRPRTSATASRLALARGTTSG